MKNGYIRIRINGKYLYEHRYIMEKLLNRPLKQSEHIHHLDGDKTNNKAKNLKLYNKQDHDSIESKNRWINHRESFFSQKERCLKPRIERHGRGKLCQRYKPCPNHPE